MKPLVRSFLVIALVNSAVYAGALFTAGMERANFAFVLMSVCDIFALVTSSSKDILTDVRSIPQLQAALAAGVVIFVGVLPVGEASISERVLGMVLGLNFFAVLLLWLMQANGKRTPPSDEGGHV